MWLPTNKYSKNCGNVPSSDGSFDKEINATIHKASQAVTCLCAHVNQEYMGESPKLCLTACCVCAHVNQGQQEAVPKTLSHSLLCVCSCKPRPTRGSPQNSVSQPVVCVPDPDTLHVMLEADGHEQPPVSPEHPLAGQDHRLASPLKCRVTQH